MLESEVLSYSLGQWEEKANLKLKLHMLLWYPWNVYVLQLFVALLLVYSILIKKQMTNNIHEKDMQLSLCL